MKTIERAIVSVFDKSGILDFVKVLVEDFGIEILSTGGTGRLLNENGIDFIKISEYTEFSLRKDQDKVTRRIIKVVLH